MKRIIICVLVMLTGMACNPSLPTGSGEEASVERPKNIILLIGDGMGLTQITAGMYINNNKLNLEKFSVIGLHKNYASDDLTTDSAAGATAFACGIKTYKGAIGVNTDTMPVKSILEIAKGRQMATGLLTTSSITHAIPASFVAHVASRQMHEEIAEYYLKTEVDFWIGGGKKYFDQREKDERDLYAELKDKNYVVMDYQQKTIKDISLNFNKKFAYFTADIEPEDTPAAKKHFLDASKLATLFLKKHANKGFFLVIDNAQIDMGGHANDSDHIVREMIEFDRVIGEVLNFAIEDGETLVILTGDHETGGYSINQNSKMDSLATSFTTDKHTAVMMPVFAYGVGSKSFAGIYENTAIYDKMLEAMGVVTFRR
jgi:alkaline phosphatase